jgi:hypothetical protein
MRGFYLLSRAEYLAALFLDASRWPDTHTITED